MPRSAIRLVTLAATTLVLTASECPFLPLLESLGVVICFEEFPEGEDIAPGIYGVELREYCPDGPVVGRMEIFFLGLGQGAPAALYTKVAGGIRVTEGAIAFQFNTMELDGQPDSRVSGLTATVRNAVGVGPGRPIELVGYDGESAEVCRATFEEAPPLVALVCTRELLQAQGLFLSPLPAAPNPITLGISEVSLVMTSPLDLPTPISFP